MRQTFIILALLTLLSSCDPFSIGNMPTSSEKDLKENFGKNNIAISNLKQFYNQITPKDLVVYIEYKNEKSIDLKVYHVTGERYPRKAVFQQWDINPFDYKKPEAPVLDNSAFAAETQSLDTIKKRLNWTQKTFKDIKEYLDKANCISVSNGNPTNIGFKRSGMGMYFYNLFDQPLINNFKKIYNDTCTYRLYNDTVVLEYGGGAIGPQCFPDK
jgi:hypothetical protein